MSARPKVLIEEWMPVQEVGAEQTREKSMGKNTFPPTVRLHVWWARRPLLVSRAAILASVLPAWGEEPPEVLVETFKTVERYHQWFLKACGILGDPVAGRKLVQWAKDQNVKLKTPPYSHPRAFTVSPSAEVLETLGKLLEATWGSRSLAMLDSFSGGGSIPFEGLRYGLQTWANELNPVACTILKCTLDYPNRLGAELAADIRRFGKELCETLRGRLEPYYPCAKGDSIHAYIWARTVRCPYTGKPIPLTPNWWLIKGADPVAVRPIFDPEAPEARFEIVKGKAACAAANPDQGTTRRGNAISPWALNQPVDGDFIKTEAQAGRLGQQLYTLAIKRPGGFVFRAPSEEDREAAGRAEGHLRDVLPRWEAEGLVPREPFPPGNDLRPLHYGMPTWGDFFSPRQLLALCTYVEELGKLRPRILAELGPERGAAVATYLGLALDKAADYNSRMVRWDGTRQKIANTFDRHDFAMKWSHAEFDASRNLFPWVLEQVSDAYAGIERLTTPRQSFFASGLERTPPRLVRGSAMALTSLESGSLDLVCVDPPYHDNVMYAECSDFFYVWLKRTVGSLHPEFFTEELTNKDDEAVANAARFTAMGRKKKQLATQDYERKMAASFREMHRVLREDGVLTVMFTHKKVEAWDTLAMSLLDAGFAIHSSWPVHTESEHSLHQAKKNAAQSTILLTCRKRTAGGESSWWEDLKPRIRKVAAEKAREYEDTGIRGVDLYIATFGPVLAVLSEHWPVLTSEVDEETGEAKTLRPEVALDLARAEVLAMRKRLVLRGRDVRFDPYSEWYFAAWDAFAAEEFPGDEARKLALALGLDLEKQIVSEKRLVAKKASTVQILPPKARQRKGSVDPEALTFACMVDAVHTALVVLEEDGLGSTEAFLSRTGLRKDPTFAAYLQTLLKAIPRTRSKGAFVRPEAELLERLRLAFYPDLEVPTEEAVQWKAPDVQGTLDLQFGAGGEEEAEADENEEDEGDDEA